jgi:hypothetical protein
MADNTTDRADGSHSEAAQEADAVDSVERNTKSQTTASSYTTTDHDVIRAWAEARGGRPAAVEETEGGNDAGLLRLEFPDNPNNDREDRLDEVAWEAFFKTFDDRKLAFVYQEKTSDGSTSRFSRFVSREDR